MSDNDEQIKAIKQSLQALNVQRLALESEAQAITSELTTPPAKGVEPMGLDTPLVDSEGFPRGDIDVYRTRTLRGRLAEIRTDHKALMREIERHLQQLALLQKPVRKDEERKEYAARMQSKPKPKYDPASGKWVVKNWDGTVAGITSGDASNFDDIGSTPSEAAINTSTPPPTPDSAVETTSTDETLETKSSVPFARVNQVSVKSPADEAGLLENDLVLQFGNVSIETSDSFARIASLVPETAAQNQTISVVILRGLERSVKRLELQPRPWEGRGLIGCHIVPYSE